jgi:hypothetical protein
VAALGDVEVGKPRDSTRLVVGEHLDSDLQSELPLSGTGIEAAEDQDPLVTTPDLCSSSDGVAFWSSKIEFRDVLGWADLVSTDEQPPPPSSAPIGRRSPKRVWKLFGGRLVTRVSLGR